MNVVEFIKWLEDMREKYGDGLTITIDHDTAFGISYDKFSNELNLFSYDEDD